MEGRFEGLAYGTVRTMPMTMLGNTLCELLGGYHQERKPGVLYES